MADMGGGERAKILSIVARAGRLATNNPASNFNKNAIMSGLICESSIYVSEIGL